MNCDLRTPRCREIRWGHWAAPGLPGEVPVLDPLLVTQYAVRRAARQRVPVLLSRTVTTCLSRTHGRAPALRYATPGTRCRALISTSSLSSERYGGFHDARHLTANTVLRCTSRVLVKHRAAFRGRIPSKRQVLRSMSAKLLFSF